VIREVKGKKRQREKEGRIFMTLKNGRHEICCSTFQDIYLLVFRGLRRSCLGGNDVEINLCITGIDLFILLLFFTTIYECLVAGGDHPPPSPRSV